MRRRMSGRVQGKRKGARHAARKAATWAPVIACALLWAACAWQAAEPAAQEQAERQGCADRTCRAEPRWAEQPPEAAEQSDPARETALAEVRVEMTDQFTDHTLVLALGDLAAATPDEWAGHIADRSNYEACVSDLWGRLHSTTAPEAPATDPEAERRLHADKLGKCIAKGQGDWAAHPPGERSGWVLEMLRAGWRITAPSETARPYIGNEEEDQGWVKLDQEYGPCRETAGPQADVAAGGPAEGAGGRFLESLGQVMACNQDVTIRSLEAEQPE